MTDEDLKQIGSLLDERLDIRLAETEQRLDQGLTNKFEKMLDERITSSEEKYTKMLDERITSSEEKYTKMLDERITSSEQYIIAEVGKFVSGQILDQIDDKAEKTEVDGIVRKLDNASAKIIEHDTRLAKVEQAILP